MRREHARGHPHRRRQRTQGHLPTAPPRATDSPDGRVRRQREPNRRKRHACAQADPECCHVMPMGRQCAFHKTRVRKCRRHRLVRRQLMRLKSITRARGKRPKPTRPATEFSANDSRMRRRRTAQNGLEATQTPNKPGGTKRPEHIAARGGRLVIVIVVVVVVARAFVASVPAHRSRGTLSRHASRAMTARAHG